MSENHYTERLKGPVSCININFDSLGWCSGVESRLHLDPTFFDVADRFFAYAEKYDFKYSIFLIGQDLESPEVRSRVREWAQAGHEIGNHSYHHYPNLGSLPRPTIEYEVLKSHEVIESACGREPRGFIAPAWTTSPDLVDVLLNANYLYDTSIFPSYFMWLVIAKLWYNFRRDPRQRQIIQRKDWWANLFASHKPYFVNGRSLIRKQKNGLLILPLPTTPLARIPCWHTAAFFFPRSLFEYALKTCMQGKYFYYVTHPADLIDQNDIPSDQQPNGNLERLDISLTTKQELFDRLLNIIQQRSRAMVTIEELALQIIGKEN